MSAATRTALASAASTVDGVVCKPYYTQNVDPGRGFVRLDTTQPDGSGMPGGWVDDWQVLVVLPQEIGAAERRLDTLVPALTTALEDEGVVTLAQPVQLPLDTGTVPVLAVTVRIPRTA